jgi:hypothetical protein
MGNPGSERARVDATMLPRAGLWQFTTSHGAIDVLHDAPSAPPYEELCRRALDDSALQCRPYFRIDRGQLYSLWSLLASAFFCARVAWPCFFAHAL